MRAQKPKKSSRVILGSLRNGRLQRQFVVDGMKHQHIIAATIT
jgi:hypothetical protein